MNSIETLARAIFGQLAPLTGARGTGTVTATATGADVVVPRNAYLAPVLNGALMHHWPFKTAANPATEQAHNQGGDWTVTSGGTQLTLVSNTGGVSRNLPAGTVLRWDPPIAGLAPTVTVDADFTGGIAGAVKDANFFEDLNTAEAQLDFFDARLGRFPALMLAWMRTTPLEGRTTGPDRGSTRKGRGVTVNHETYVLYVITSRKDADPRRRREGLDLLEAVSQSLTDRKSNDDGEVLAAMGSVEVLERARVARSTTAYVYGVTLRTAMALCKTDTRTFAPWLRTRYVDKLKADPPLPEGQKIDVTFPMT